MKIEKEILGLALIIGGCLTYKEDETDQQKKVRKIASILMIAIGGLLVYSWITKLKST